MLSVTAFGLLIDGMRSQPPFSCVSPIVIKREVERVAPQFNGYRCAHSGAAATEQVVCRRYAFVGGTAAAGNPCHAVPSASAMMSSCRSGVHVIEPLRWVCSQHDCQEFLRFVLDGLHEDLNRVAGQVGR